MNINMREACPPPGGNMPIKQLAALLMATGILCGALAQAAHAEAKSTARWKQPRTPWGDPDLQGTWPISHLMGVPLQRPPQYGNRRQFTPEELAQQRKATDAQNHRYQAEESQH